MTQFAEEIKARKLILDAARQTLAGETDVVINRLEYRICELESDLELENDANTDLHSKLKEVSGKRDEYRELVGELVSTIHDCTGWNWCDADMPQNVIDRVEASITKAKESMP